MRRKSKAELLLLQDVKWLLSDPRGMRTVARLMQETGYFDPPFRGDVERLNFHAGRRHAGHWLLNLIVANYPTSLLECLDELSQASDARRTGTDAADSDPGDAADSAS
jgi:hypothetical protein